MIEALEPALHIYKCTNKMQRIGRLWVSQNNYSGRHILPAAPLECRFHRLALMCSSLWFMESQVAIRSPQLALSTALEIQGKHFSENMMWHSRWRQQSMDVWNAFILDSPLPQRRKLKRITQYGCILNFPSGNKPLKIHTRDSLDCTSTAWKMYLWHQSAIICNFKSWHEAEICALFRGKGTGVNVTGYYPWTETLTVI